MPDENQIIEPLREQAARNEEAGFPHPVVHLASAEAAVREAFAAGRAAGNARIVAALRTKGTHAADVLADQIEKEAP